ncbi:hypothetical protein PSTG_17420 [Puccinia striiformis f. sp. tritici PST-78]|uniref:Uncharacterized protein n=1 Tax=Puccinia striiformis f. sp. tritici PST-78 TaxID=1165861 RepID=A0A0L0UQ24_9BASI|nr:hypothetical protein PSTG_17420 [Puccinia striiformis f. sp. tritici PST-78]
MDKQSAIFLYIVGQNGTNRQTQDRFQHSGKTISRVFHHIIYLFLQLQKKYIVTPPVNIAHESILENQKFSPFFDRCIGAMDGCHVPAFVPEHMAGPYRNRKGMLSQNVLGVVDFNMKFTYMMVGWEGSAHNSRVLGSAMSEDFSIPNSSCYLADAGYSLGKGMLVPYCGVWYHLRENAQAGQRPANKEEHFNLRHAMLQNVVERTFETWKKRFPILVHPLEYSLATQGNLVLALAVQDVNGTCRVGSGRVRYEKRLPEPEPSYEGLGLGRVRVDPARPGTVNSLSNHTPWWTGCAMG